MPQTFDMLKRNFHIGHILIIIFGFVSSGNLWADTNSDVSSIFDALSYKEVVDITIEGDISFLIENRRDQEDHEAIMSFEDKDGNLQEWTVNLSIRGKFRRMFSKGVPPLKLDFKKKILKEQGLKAYDDIKLVTLFHADKKEAYQTLVKEFLTYKIYNVLAEESYRVQLLKIKFKDSSSGKTFKENGFIIEDYAQLLDRIGAKKIENISELTFEDFDSAQTEFVSLFQYMIGNGDWGLTTKKNIEICEKDGRAIAIPFDFDFCGLVDASYAVPNNIYNISSVRDRIYLGRKDSLQEILGVYSLFENKKEEILEITSKCKLLSRESRNKTTDYLRSFF